LLAVVEPIYHLALRGEWDSCVTRGHYDRSTLGQSLDEVGFIHCSFAHQVQGTADRFYAGREDVVLLMIDPSRLSADVRIESLFPHIYGPLPMDAVTTVTPLAVGDDGCLVIEL
jgi:glutathione S-transferase